MQTLNALLALGGERDTTVPKYGITPAEARILQFLHGDDAVFDVEPADEINISPRELRAQLIEKFPKKKEETKPAFDEIFPSVNDVPQTVEDLGLHDELFKVLERVTAKAPPKRGKKVQPDPSPFDEN